MASSDRHSAADLIERLQGRLGDAGFFQAVRLFNRIARRAGARSVGSSARPQDEAVQFRSAFGMRHATREIAGSRLTDAGKPELTIAFLGLTGPTGALPDFYTELAVTQRQARRPALSAFLDLFNHRTASLFYRVWAKYRLPVRFEEAEQPLSDPFSVALSSLAGLGLGESQRALVEDGGRLLGMANILARGAASARALEHSLRSQFDFAVKIVELHGRWITIPQDERTRLAAAPQAYCILGETAVLGAQVWDIQGRFRVRIGPVGLEQFNRFFEDEAFHREVVSTIRLAAGRSLDFDLQLVLDRTQAPCARLSNQGAPSRLGQNSWMHSTALQRDPDDAVLIP